METPIVLLYAFIWAIGVLLLVMLKKHRGYPKLLWDDPESQLFSFKGWLDTIGLLFWPLLFFGVAMYVLSRGIPSQSQPNDN